jgi:hypothetical protein
MADQLSILFTEMAKAGPWAITAGALIWFLQRDIKAALGEIVSKLAALQAAPTAIVAKLEDLVNEQRRYTESKMEDHRLDEINGKLDKLLKKKRVLKAGDKQ